MSKLIEVDQTAGSKPIRFFQKQLAGEEGPSLETARRLCEIATEFAAQQPWRFMADEDLVLLQDPRSGDICYCSVMGALGEVFSLHVYMGTESYRFLRRIATGQPISPGEFFASQHALSAELVRRSELTPPDRDLLQAVGHPMQKGVRVPLFRAYRPGYHPWYVTQDEATLLFQCLQAVLTFCRSLPEGDGSTYWKEENVYPFLVPVGNEEVRRDYEVRLAKASEPPPMPPQIPHLDDAAIGKLREKNYAPGGILEADHCFTGVMVGNKNERKACLRVGLVTDAATGIVFPPELGNPEDLTGDILVRAVLAAIQTARVLPKEIRVKEKPFKMMLDPLAASLGFSVRVAKSIRSLELAKNHLLGMMGDSGPFTG